MPGLADQHGGAELGGAGRQLLLVVEPERVLVDPRVDDELAELLEDGHPRSAERRGREDDGTVGH